MGTNDNDRDEIEGLRAFALAHREIQFSHLCTAALNGEEWAVERVEHALDRIADGDGHGQTPTDTDRLAVIRTTDTTNPDGSTARGLKLGAP